MHLAYFRFRVEGRKDGWWKRAFSHILENVVSAATHFFLREQGHQSLTSGMELRNNILVSGNADSTVKVWDIISGACLQTLSGERGGANAPPCLGGARELGEEDGEATLPWDNQINPTLHSSAMRGWGADLPMLAHVTPRPRPLSKVEVFVAGTCK